MKIHGNDFRKIMQFFVPTRTLQQLKYHHQVCLKPRIRLGELNDDEKLKRLDVIYMKKYGISYSVGVTNKLIAQDYKCEFCGGGSKDSIKSEKLVVDHNHHTKENCDVLCNRCNMCYHGSVDEKVYFIDGMKQYYYKHSGTEMPQVEQQLEHLSQELPYNKYNR